MRGGVDKTPLKPMKPNVFSLLVTRFLGSDPVRARRGSDEYRSRTRRHIVASKTPRRIKTKYECVHGQGSVING
jgi:hypothetical protein